ncbi:SDR family NAD(P)-dependent oxidoreductase, partial [Streptomyces albidoflavus]
MAAQHTEARSAVPGDLTFRARTAVVTGADSGIGRAVAVRLAEQGLDVGITWHSDAEGAHATADEVRRHGRRAVVEHLDLTRLPEAAD